MHHDSLFCQSLSVFLNKQDVRNIRLCNRHLNSKWQQVSLDIEIFKFPFDAETQNYVCKGAKRLQMRQDFNETLLNDDDLLQKQALLQHSSYSNRIYQCNQSLQKQMFPCSLLQLTMGDNFNQTIAKGALPKSLLYLTMGILYNQTIQQGMLPQGLLHLTMGSSYNQPMQPGVLPQSLLYLTM